MNPVKGQRFCGFQVPDPYKGINNPSSGSIQTLPFYSPYSDVYRPPIPLFQRNFLTAPTKNRSKLLNYRPFSLDHSPTGIIAQKVGYVLAGNQKDHDHHFNTQLRHTQQGQPNHFYSSFTLRRDIALKGIRRGFFNYKENTTPQCDMIPPPNFGCTSLPKSDPYLRIHFQQ
jgi:hypothetical protein